MSVIHSVHNHHTPFPLLLLSGAFLHWHKTPLYLAFPFTFSSIPSILIQASPPPPPLPFPLLPFHLYYCFIASPNFMSSTITLPKNGTGGTSLRLSWVREERNNWAPESKVNFVNNNNNNNNNNNKMTKKQDVLSKRKTVATNWVLTSFFYLAIYNSSPVYAGIQYRPSNENGYNYTFRRFSADLMTNQKS